MDLKEKLLGRPSFPNPTGSWGYPWGVELWGRDGASGFFALIKCCVYRKKIYISSLKMNNRRNLSCSIKINK